MRRPDNRGEDCRDRHALVNPAAERPRRHVVRGRRARSSAFVTAVPGGTTNTTRERTGARRRRPWRRLVGWAAGSIVLAAAAMHTHVVVAAAPHTFTVATAPAADCILVPGARIHADGTPFDLLADRLAAARDLYASGKAPCIVLSGRGDGAVGDDEVAAMRRWLIARGVPGSALVDDALGLRTLDTMQRCHDRFGARRVLVVTNPFHVARSVFLARAVGLDAHGVEAPYRRTYSTGTMLRNRGREVAARVRAWLDVHVLGAGR
jgi:vancomycin permeability regulator SanA